MTNRDEKKDRAKNYTNWYRWYLPEMADRKKEMNDERKMSGGEVLTATFLSTLELSQTGTRMMAPPSPNAPPARPAMNP